MKITPYCYESQTHTHISHISHYMQHYYYYQLRWSARRTDVVHPSAAKLPFWKVVCRGTSSKWRGECDRWSVAWKRNALSLSSLDVSNMLAHLFLLVRKLIYVRWEMSQRMSLSPLPKKIYDNRFTRNLIESFNAEMNGFAKAVTHWFGAKWQYFMRISKRIFVVLKQMRHKFYAFYSFRPYTSSRIRYAFGIQWTHVTHATQRPSPSNLRTESMHSDFTVN